MKKALSICIPTNGVVEWVFPVIDSILTQGCNAEDYEIVVTDNGNNEEFEKTMKKYVEAHSNIVYRKVEAKGFLNQIESFVLAEGDFIKFQNHRALMRKGALPKLITFAKDNITEKPNIFFLDGRLKLPETVNEYDSFDSFVKALSYYSSWSGGLAFWKENHIGVLSKASYDELFPHMDILFYRRNDQKYIINNEPLAVEIEAGHSKKGSYNLFYTFAVHFLDCIKSLLENDDISNETFSIVRNDTKGFIADLYKEFIILKKPCSYDLTNTDEYINKYFNARSIKRSALMRVVYQKLRGAIRINKLSIF